MRVLGKKEPTDQEIFAQTIALKTEVITNLISENASLKAQIDLLKEIILEIKKCV